jgi:hypothetical protein
MDNGLFVRRRILMGDDIILVRCLEESGQGISVDVEELTWHTETFMYVECLPAFPKLRRLTLWYYDGNNLQGLENLFIEELHLISVSDFDMKGIEKLPIENSKNIFLDHLFSINHKINTIYAKNTPCLNVYKDKVNLTII